MALNDRQQRFALEYALDPNATQAAIKAGYSERSAYSTADDLLKKPEIQAAILDAQRRINERIELTAEWALKQLINEATFRGEGSSHSARVRALELLGKHLDIFEDRFRMIPGEQGEQTPYERRLDEFRKRYGDASSPAPAGGGGGGGGTGGSTGGDGPGGGVADAVPADGKDGRP